MTENKPTVRGSRWNKDMLNALGVARSSVAPGRDVQVELNAKGLAVVKNGMYCGVTKGASMVLGVKFESIVVLENGWMVASKHGIYNLYNKEGSVYKGLSFLKKENAIKFAKTL